MVVTPFFFGNIEDIPVTMSEDYLVDVPQELRSDSDLFTFFSEAAHFPEYFGENWDALLDCLRDFTWVPQKKIYIVHRTLPSLPESDLKTYLKILAIAVEDWRKERKGPFAEIPPGMPPFVPHELVVIFPKDSEKEVSGIVQEYFKERASSPYYKAD